MLLKIFFICHRRRRTHSQDIVDIPTKGSALQSMTEGKRPPVLRKYFVSILLKVTV